MIRRIGGVDADFLEARLQESMQTQHQKTKSQPVKKGFLGFGLKRKF